MTRIPLSLRNIDVDEKRRAFSVALRMLARRDATVAEIERRLNDKGIASPLIDETVVHLQEKGFLDDRRFARQWAESAIRSGRGFGPRIRLELERRGVPPDIVAEELAGLAGEYEELELISALLAKKFQGFAAANATDREKHRVMQYFKRRGFSTAAIIQAFRMGDDL